MADSVARTNHVWTDANATRAGLSRCQACRHYLYQFWCRSEQRCVRDQAHVALMRKVGVEIFLLGGWVLNLRRSTWSAGACWTHSSTQSVASSTVGSLYWMRELQRTRNRRKCWGHARRQPGYSFNYYWMLMHVPSEIHQHICLIFNILPNILELYTFCFLWLSTK